MQINYDDIGQYQACPLLFTKFKTSKPEHIDNPLNNFIMFACFKVMAKTFEIEYVPSFWEMSLIINREIEKLKLVPKINKKNINSAVIHIKEFLSKYQQEIHSKGMYPLAFNYDAFLSYGSLTYTENIPAILISNNKELVTVYPRYVAKYPHHNNLIRFNAAVLNEITGIDVVGNVMISGHYIKGTRISYHAFKTDEIIRAKKELINILKQMNNKQHTPNTNHCVNCDFLNSCRL